MHPARAFFSSSRTSKYFHYSRKMSLWEASKKRLVSIVFSDGSYRKTAAYFLDSVYTN